MQNVLKERNYYHVKINKCYKVKLKKKRKTHKSLAEDFRDNKKKRKKKER